MLPLLLPLQLQSNGTQNPVEIFLYAFVGDFKEKKNCEMWDFQKVKPYKDTAQSSLFSKVLT